MQQTDLNFSKMFTLTIKKGTCTHMEQNRFLFFSRIHTKKYQFSFQGGHLKNNGNLKCGQIRKFKKQTCM